MCPCADEAGGVTVSDRAGAGPPALTSPMAVGHAKPALPSAAVGVPRPLLPLPLLALAVPPELPAPEAARAATRAGRVLLPTLAARGKPGAPRRRAGLVTAER